MENKDYCRWYRETHKEELAAYRKEYREKHKEEIAASRKQYYEKHKEQFAERQKTYYAKHKDDPEYIAKTRESCARWRRENRDRYNAHHRAWRKARKEQRSDAMLQTAENRAQEG